MKSANRPWRNIPNAISLARLLATPVLIGSIVASSMDLFKWLLLACLLSDIADGWIARALDIRSRLGAVLDSTADLLVSVIAVFGVFRFRPEFVSEHYGPVLLVIGLYVGENALAFWCYRRLSSFHTMMSRVAAYVQGVFVMSLFLWGYQSWLFMAMIVVSTVAYLEEIALLWVLREWRPDVRGLYWVLSVQREQGEGQ